MTEPQYHTIRQCNRCHTLHEEVASCPACGGVEYTIFPFDPMGEDYQFCRLCGWVGHNQDFDTVGADDGNAFCPTCGLESRAVVFEDIDIPIRPLRDWRMMDRRPIDPLPAVAPAAGQRTLFAE